MEELSFKIVKLIGSRQERGEIVLQSKQSPDMSGGFREGTVRLAKRAFGNASRRTDHFEVEGIDIMSKVKIYKYKMLYNPGTDYEKIAKRMGTRSYIETLKGCSIIEKSELEVDSSKVDTEGKTEIGFMG
jgi:hypothetical protein